MSDLYDEIQTMSAVLDSLQTEQKQPVLHLLANHLRLLGRHLCLEGQGGALPGGHVPAHTGIRHVRQ